MNHDRIHAQKPDHDLNRRSVGTIDTIAQQDGHCVVTVSTEDDDLVELVVTLAIQNLFERPLGLVDGESATGDASGIGNTAGKSHHNVTGDRLQLIRLVPCHG